MTSSPIPVPEADALLTAFQEVFPEETIPLAEATGRVLRQPVRADREYPAQDRSRMDGIAISFAAWEMGVRDFRVGGMARAGEARRRLDDAAGCVEIMTGAPCPEGADTVIPYEALKTREFGENGVASVASDGKGDATLARGQFLHAQGSDCKRGEILVATGERLNAVRVAAAASMGYAQVTVTRRPRIGIVTTGDELVAVEDVPEPHQVRASNGHALRALFEGAREGMGTVSLHSAGDARDALAARLQASLAASDVLLVTGGVSAGKFDEVPGVLRDLGVERVFHKVAQKPGKPLWFGTGPAGQLVFGLPGNPVSALVCARRYVVPLLRAKSGRTADPAPRMRFSGPLPAPSRLTQFVPVRLAGSEAVPCAVNGSGDFSGLGRSDGFVEIPPRNSSGEKDFPPMPADELLSFFGWEP